MEFKFNKGLTVFTILLFLLFTQSLFAEQTFSIFPNGEKPNGFVFTISLFLALIVALGIHELGHLLTGLFLGFRFELFVIFLLGVKRTENGIRPFLNRNLGYMGGVAATVPTSDDPKNRRIFAFIMLAGPIASLLFTVISFLFLKYTQNFLWSFWLFSAATSIGLFLVTTLPRKTGVYFSDRARFQRLISNGQEGKSEEALLKILAQVTLDNSYNNISLKDAQILQRDKEPFMQFWGSFYAYEFLKANGNNVNAAEAKRQLFGLRNVMSKSVWKALKIEDS